MKTSELTGAALIWAVATCEGYTDYDGDTEKMLPPRKEYGWVSLCDLDYDTWEKCGPIIEREKITLDYDFDGQGLSLWTARKYAFDGTLLFAEFGETPLVAAMRCFCASRLGDEVDVPAELAALVKGRH